MRSVLRGGTRALGGNGVTPLPARERRSLHLRESSPGRGASVNALVVVICPVCERKAFSHDDLPEGHGDGFKRCPGKPEAFEYVRAGGEKWTGLDARRLVAGIEKGAQQS